MMTKRLPREYGEPKELYAIDKEKLEERIKRIGGNMTDFGQTTAYVLNVLKNCLVPLEKSVDDRVTDALGRQIDAMKPTPEEQTPKKYSCPVPACDGRCVLQGNPHVKPTEQEVCSQCGSDEIKKDAFGHAECRTCGRISKPAPAEEYRCGGCGGQEHNCICAKPSLDEEWKCAGCSTCTNGPATTGEMCVKIRECECHFKPSDFWERFDESFPLWLCDEIHPKTSDEWVKANSEVRNWLKRELKQELESLRMAKDITIGEALEHNAKLDELERRLGLL